MNWRKWLDGFVLAGKGVLLATGEKRFWLGAVPAFLVFGTLMNLLSGGVAKFELMGAVGIGDGLKIIWDALVGVLGIGRAFGDWLPVFAVALLQSTLIGLIVLLWQKKQQGSGAKNGVKAIAKRAAAPAKPNKKAKTEQTRCGERKTEQTGVGQTKADGEAVQTTNAENVGSAGIITGLIALGAGCPTCGATLITPLIGAVAGTGALAVGQAVSTVVTWLAVMVAVLSLKRLGEEAYVVLVNERYLKKHRQKGVAYAKSA